MISARKSLPYILVFIAGFVLTYLLLTLFYPLKKEPGSIPLKITGLWSVEVFDTVKEDFLNKYPEVSLTYQPKDQQQYFANLKAELNKTTPPDVFWWHSGWGPLLGGRLDTVQGSLFSTSSFERTFYPITKTDLKIGGSYRGVPLEIDSLALLYNKELLTAKNFASAPSTWDSLRSDFIPSLTTADKEKIYSSAIALGSANNVENLSEIIGLFLLQNGVEFTKNGKLVIEEKDNKELATSALDFFYKFSKEDKTWNNTQPNSLEAFARGKVAMIILPAYKIHDLLAFIKSENLTLNFAVEPVPQLPSSPIVNWGAYWSLGVDKESPQKKYAWEFVKYMTGPETLRKVFELESKADGLGRAYPRVEMAKEQTTNIYLAAYLAQAQSAKSWFLHSDTFDEDFNDELSQALKEALLEMEQGKATNGALKSFSENIKPTLEKYGLVSPE